MRLTIVSLLLLFVIPTIAIAREPLIIQTEVLVKPQRPQCQEVPQAASFATVRAIQRQCEQLTRNYYLELNAYEKAYKAYIRQQKEIRWKQKTSDWSTTKVVTHPDGRQTVIHTFGDGEQPYYNY